MDHAAVVRVGDRVADLEEDLEPVFEALGRADGMRRDAQPLRRSDMPCTSFIVK